MTYEQIVELAKKSLDKTAAKEIKENTAVEFDIYGEGEGAFYVQIIDGKLLVEPYEYYDRDAKIIITGEELEKIIEGEKTPEQSLGEGIMMLEGDRDAALRLFSLVKSEAKKTAVKKETAKKPVKKAVAKKTTKAEKEIVEMTKKPANKVAKDIVK